MSLYSGAAWHTLPDPEFKYDPGQLTRLPTPTVEAAIPTSPIKKRIKKNDK